MAGEMAKRTDVEGQGRGTEEGPNNKGGYKRDAIICGKEIELMV